MPQDGLKLPRWRRRNGGGLRLKIIISGSLLTLQENDVTEKCEAGVGSERSKLKDAGKGAPISKFLFGPSWRS